MKRHIWMIGLTLCLALLCGCGQRACGDQPAAGAEQLPGGEASMLCRVVDEDDGVLLLAKADGSPTDVYSLSTQGVSVGYEDRTTDEIEEGALVEVQYSGAIEETYPAKLGSVASILVKADGFDDLSALYLDALDDLWEKDEGLSSGVKQLGLDLSETRLPPAEQGAVAVALGWEFNLPVTQGTWDELADQGYIDRENLVWEDGLFLNIEETDRSAAGRVTFTAGKWRSGLGAYYFTDCTSQQDKNGHWSDYRIGAEAIS